MDSSLDALARRVGTRLQAKGWTLATAESCTGGWVAKAITDIPGSSAWFDRGFVTYSNAAKRDMLGVGAATLDRYGAVSEETVRAMAVGALAHSRVDVAVAISGIAGPGGGSEEKPVGTVCFAWALRGNEPVLARELFGGPRDRVRKQSVALVLKRLVEML